jgi:signal transduction histidine kinase
MSALYDELRRALAELHDAPGFLATPPPDALVEEIIGAATALLPARFEEPPWRFVVVAGEEREALVAATAEALARHWGLGRFGPRGLASDEVLSAPALVVVLSTVPAAEGGVEPFAAAAAVAQNFTLLAHAAGLATHRLYSPHVVPESVLDWLGERLGAEVRRGELVAMLALGFPTAGDAHAAATVAAAASRPDAPATSPHWIGRGGPPAPPRAPILPASPEKPAPALRAEHGERVLVADPYRYNRDLLTAQLGAAGYRVRAFADGQSLLAEVAAAGEPDLYVTAEALPDTTGFELVRRLRAAPGPHPPILFTTARRDSAFRTASLTVGVDYYLRKPPNPIELYTAARSLLERHRLVGEQRARREELERLVGELRQAQARLVQQAKMASLGQLVAGVAHEINTPLAAVVSNNDLYLRAFDRLRTRLAGSPLVHDPVVARDLEAVTALAEVTRAATGRITGIVRSLRTFARLDEAEVKAVDLHQGIESTLVLIAHLLKAGITVEKRYGELPPVECHPNQINQVFMNLLVNACQAIDGAGRISIETAWLPPGGGGGGALAAGGVDSGGRVRIAIGDTGRGIPAEHVPRIFDPGFTTKGAGVGTGLGLSICYQIVDAHGGEITLSSARGEGAVFTVTLPVKQPGT